MPSSPYLTTKASTNLGGFMFSRWMVATFLLFISLTSHAKGVVFMQQTIKIPKEYKTYCFYDFPVHAKKHKKQVTPLEWNILKAQDPNVIAALSQGIRSKLKSKGFTEDCVKPTAEIIVSYVAANQSVYVPQQQVNIPIYNPGTTIYTPNSTVRTSNGSVAQVQGSRITTPGTISSSPITWGGYYKNGLNVQAYFQVMDSKTGYNLFTGKAEKFYPKVTTSKIVSLGAVTTKYLVLSK